MLEDCCFLTEISPPHLHLIFLSFHRFGGMSALYCGLLVAYKQAYPQWTLRISAITIEARVRNEAVENVGAEEGHG